MMYLGDPPELIEHLLVLNKSKCLEMKQIAEETSFAYYECAKVDAIIKGIKIINTENHLQNAKEIGGTASTPPLATIVLVAIKIG